MDFRGVSPPTDSPVRWCDRECDKRKPGSRFAFAADSPADLAALPRARFDGRAIFSVETPELKPFKKCRPTGIERVGILLPSVVILLEQIEIRPGGK